MLVSLKSKLVALSAPPNPYACKSEIQLHMTFAANRHTKSQASQPPHPGPSPYRVITPTGCATRSASHSRTGVLSSARGPMRPGPPEGGVAFAPARSDAIGPTAATTAVTTTARATADAASDPLRRNPSCTPIRTLQAVAARTQEAAAAAATAAAAAAGSAVRIVQTHRLEWLGGFRSSLGRLASSSAPTTAPATTVGTGTKRRDRNLVKHLSDALSAPAAPASTAAVAAAAAAVPFTSTAPALAPTGAWGSELGPAHARLDDAAGQLPDPVPRHSGDGRCLSLGPMAAAAFHHASLSTARAARRGSPPGDGTNARTSSTSSSTAAAAAIAAAGGEAGTVAAPGARPPAAMAAAAATEAAAAGARPPGSGPTGPTHLVVMANGLFGSPSNWSVICEQLREHLDASAVVLHPSQVNRRTDTYDGIDVCGQRLAQEIRRVAAAHPSLERISVIGHSMGGLLLRYAIGLLYDPARGRVAGLRPCHFISLATPHLGCDAEGLAQVPFIGWAPELLQPVLQRVSTQTAGLIFGRTGRQFFLADADTVFSSGITVATSRDTVGATTIHTATTARAGGSSSSPRPSSATSGSNSNRTGGSSSNQTGGSSSNQTGGSSSNQTGGSSSNRTGGSSTGGNSGARGGQLAASRTAAASATVAAPLLYRVTQDEPRRGHYFYSALASFASRTAYANTDGDHLVGWANSSLRFLHQLPRLPPEAARARGVVLQDPLLAAFDVRSKPEPEPQTASGRADLPIDLGNGYGNVYDNNREGNGDSAAARVHSRGADVTAAGAAAAGARSMSTAAAMYGSNDGGGGGGGSTAATAAILAETMLRRLQRLPWRRVDVSFQGGTWGFAHNNIQVTRRWLNFEGMAVAQHLARQVVALEAEWVRMERERQTREAAAATAAASVAAAAAASSGADVSAQAALQAAAVAAAPAGVVQVRRSSDGAGGARVVREPVTPAALAAPGQEEAAPHGTSGWAAPPQLMAAVAAIGLTGEGRSQEPLLTAADAAAMERQLAEAAAEDKQGGAQTGMADAARAEVSVQP